MSSHEYNTKQRILKLFVQCSIGTDDIEMALVRLEELGENLKRHKADDFEYVCVVDQRVDLILGLKATDSEQAVMECFTELLIYLKRDNTSEKKNQSAIFKCTHRLI